VANAEAIWTILITRLNEVAKEDLSGE